MQQRASSAKLPLMDLLWPLPAGTGRLLRAFAIALLGSALLTVSAKIQVPFYPVPMTLQTAAVFLLGFALGWRMAALTVALYLLQGAMGLPVFAGTPAKGIGLAYMMGPTGGYLVGFLLAAAITGWAAETVRGTIPTAAAVLAATLAIYACGAAWLASFVGFDAALTAGVLPFLLGDALKLLLVVALVEVGLGSLRRRLTDS
jgi:biotin transport system substrate-specific component